MSSFKYRPDIDGLRALAVVLVLLFHFNLGFAGGFVGVDVFFVISGYLITGLILKDQSNGHFSLARFWLRRIRRILPASTVMVLATLVAGFFLLWPDEFADLAKSTIAQQLMLANVYFWDTSDYFSRAAELKPLLHTWSLAVEEQFYLFYPFLLVLLRKLSGRQKAAVLTVLALGSFAISVYGVSEHPLATFFLLPGRMWEMLAGGLICFAPSPARLKPWFLNILSVAGVLAIVATAYAYTAATPFPGVAALLPCSAAALLIYSSCHSLTWPARILASRPLVAVGLISYSLYLWHWPVLAVLRSLYGLELPLTIRLAALAASFAMGYASYRWVERPFRNGVLIASTRQLLAATVATPLVLAACSAAIILTDGLPYRVNPQAIHYRNAIARGPDVPVVTLEQARVGAFPRFGAADKPQRCLLWGDSHAMSLLPAVEKACRSAGVSGVVAANAATPPLMDFVPATGMKQKAPAFNKHVAEFAVKNKIELVILAGFWVAYAGDPDFSPCVRQTVEYLHQAGIQVVIVKDVAQQKDVPAVLAQAAIAGDDVSQIGTTLSAHRVQQKRCDDVFKSIAQPGLQVVDPASYFVSGGIWRVEYDGHAMYRDRHHLTIEGALRLEPMFTSVLAENSLVTDLPVVADRRDDAARRDVAATR